MSTNYYAKNKAGVELHIAKSSDGAKFSSLQGGIYNSVKEWIDFLNSDDCVKIYNEYHRDEDSKEHFIAKWLINNKGTSAYQKGWLKDNGYSILPTPAYVDKEKIDTQHWMDGAFLFTGGEFF